MHKSHLIKPLTIVAFTQVGALIFGLFFQIILAKVMLPHEYAAYAVALAGAALFASLASFGISRAIARFLPVIILKGGKRTLRSALARYAICRAGGILLVTSLGALVLWLFHVNWILEKVYEHQIVLIWFVLNLLQMDAEAIAQSLMEQGLLSVATLMEVVARASLTTAAILSGHLDAITVISIWSLTSTMLILIIVSVIRLKRHKYRLGIDASNDIILDTQLNPRVQLSFALGIYISSFGWLATSPASIRLVSAPFLPVIPLAAVSFIQGLVSSLQRALPLQLLAAAIEPILINNVSQTGDIAKAHCILSLLVKFETIVVLFGVAVVYPIAPMLIQLLAREEFASYAYVIPVMLLLALGASYYRSLEIVAGIELKHRVFAATLPLGVACLALIFMTTPQLGVLAIVLWPSIELLLRIAILRAALRNHGAERTLDIRRLIPLLMATAVLVFLCETAIGEFEHDPISRVLMSIASGTAFLLLLPILRPFRSEEYHFVADALPAVRGRRFNSLRWVAH